jgi:hypothetical protein
MAGVSVCRGTFLSSVNMIVSILALPEQHRWWAGGQSEACDYLHRNKHWSFFYYPINALFKQLDWSSLWRDRKEHCLST